MALTEFNLIKQFFTRPAGRKSTQLSVGDDCALLSVPAGYEMAITVDTMVEGVHFFEDVEPELLGHKLIAVNLSDLSSMGAEPIAVSLAITLPKVDRKWVVGFSQGLFALLDKYNVDLIGGDTTSGPLTLTVQAMGVVPCGQALLRSAAEVGDLIYVTGCVGDAGLGLKVKQGYEMSDARQVLKQFNQPEPRINEGQELRCLANACIDISDGLVADLGHILEKSNVGASLDYQNIPMTDDVKVYMRETQDWRMPLVAGDDYELCFTISPEKAKQLTIECTCIGVVERKLGLRIKRGGQEVDFESGGFEHFS